MVNHGSWSTLKKLMVSLLFVALLQSQLFGKEGPSIQLDWSTVAPYRVLHTGTYTINITGVNDLVYQYELSVTLNDSSSNDIALLTGILPDLTKLLGTSTTGRSVAPGCNLPDLLTASTPVIKTFNDRLTDMTPGKSSDGKYLSVPLSDSIVKWNAVKEAYVSYQKSVADLAAEIKNSNCTLASEDTAKAQQVLDTYSTVRLKVEAIDAKAKGDHRIVGHAYIDRSRDGDIIVRQLFNGAETSSSPKTFPLEAGFSVVTATGGFLLTTLQARTYTSQLVPPVPPATTNSNVLAVSGVSGVRPALVALLNYHDPFDWYLNRENFGLALSAGPVIDVSKGKADTSTFGFFGGISMHLWHRVFVTPGVHVGEFADFPAGFTKAGQVIPPNFGTLNPVIRYTAKFGLSITFRGGNPSTLVGTGTKQTSGAAPPATSGVKQ